MSKVLISFLGTGKPVEGKDREYESATYKFSHSENEYKLPFVAGAIYKEYNVDKVLMIGTMHSIWDSVYDHFITAKGEEPDIEVWEQIYQHCKEANHKTPLAKIAHCEKIEQALGEGSKVIPIYYGINQMEIEENAKIILSLEQYLQKGDELIIDITHSFRSLPLYIMNLIIYLRNVSEKRLKISHICYGMLDVAREIGYAPIIDLGGVLLLNEWISGAYSFQQFGNAEKIAELVSNIDNGLSGKLLDFSDTKNLNHLAALEQQSVLLKDMLKKKNLPPIADMIITPVIRDFAQRLSIDQGHPYRHSQFQSKLARWQFNNHNYLASYISLTEAIITYWCEKRNELSEDEADVFNREYREETKKLIRDETYVYINDDWKNLFSDISKMRNALAHNLPKNTGKKLISISKEYIGALHKFLGRYDMLCKQ